MPLVARNLTDLMSVSRASSGTFFNSAGTLQTAGNNTARIDYDPSTLSALGLLIEDQGTNFFTNNTMAGAVAGTPGTAPTGWSVAGTLNGLTRTIVGTGTEDGISYIDIRYAGTTTAAAVATILPIGTTAQAGSSGQTWATSFFVKLQAGSTANLTSITLSLTGRDGTGTALENTSLAITPTSAALRTQRRSVTRALNNAGTVNVTGQVNINYPTGVAVDITLRIGMPQLEQQAFATSVISTTTVAVTRAADSVTIASLPSWFNPAAGTFMAEARLRFTPPYSVGTALVDVTDGTTNNRLLLRMTAQTTTSDQFTVRSAGATTFQNSSTNATTGSTKRVAGAYAAADFAITSSGSSPVTQASGALPTSLTQATIGSASSAEFLNGWLARLTYWPRRLSNAEMQSVTT